MTLNPADDAFRAQLLSIVAEDVLTQPGPAHLQEPRGRYAGQGGVLAMPRSTEEVAAILRAANAARVGVVPYGGGTGLVGGQVMPEGPAPLILSLERMSAIRAVYPQENVLIAEAGAILANIQSAAQVVDRLFPLSLASEGSARIGGNLATNAGGVNVLRYGNTRDLCLGLEVVFANGDVWHGLSRLRKDNTGFDLRNLLIGSEGSLGVITAASLKLSPIPAGMGTAMIVVPSPQAALELLSLARSKLGEAVSAFELIHRQSLEFLAETELNVRVPFDDLPEWCVLIEVGLSAGLEPETALMPLFEEALGGNIATDGVIAQSETQRAAMWNVRENIPEANRRIGSVSSHDISIPIGTIPDFIATAPSKIAEIGDFRINCFGHVGDGNLHYNVFPQQGRSRADHENERGAIKEAVHDLVHAFGGSVSAEHGIGRLKVDDLEKYGDPVKRATMRAIKTALDPNGIMNPGAILRAG